jgi:hypothetical protein
VDRWTTHDEAYYGNLRKELNETPEFKTTIGVCELSA